MAQGNHSIAAPRLVPELGPPIGLPKGLRPLDTGGGALTGPLLPKGPCPPVLGPTGADTGGLTTEDVESGPPAG